MVVSFLILAAALDDSGRSAVEALAKSLSEIRQCSFTYKRVVDYPDENVHHELVSECYVDLTARNVVDAKFQLHLPDSAVVFNGNTLFDQEGTKKPRIKFKPTVTDLEVISMLKNSVVGLEKSLRGLLADKSSTFRVMAPGKMEINSEKIEINVAGLSSIGYDPRYEIEVDGKTGLPMRIVQYFRNPKDTVVTTFTKWNLQPPVPAASTWTPKGS